MRRMGAATMMWLVLLPLPVAAQAPAGPGSARPVRVVVASGRLPNVVEGPLHFRLVRVILGAGQSSVCSGPSGMLYVQSGGIDGSVAGEARTLREGQAAFLPAGARTSLTALPGAPATLLHFLLSPVGDLAVMPCAGPAVATELYRTPRPVAGLKPGPYEFGMSRVTVQKGIPRPPLHHRSGAALYYVLTGSWALHQEASHEPRTRGAVQFEPYDFIHTWENTGESTGILLQANLSPEGAPEIIFLPAR